MIFLSLGTHEQPFGRAVDMVAPLARDESVIIQRGHTPTRSIPGITWHDYVPYEEMVRLLGRCRAFVCHAGVGSVLTALQQGVTPVVLARERRFSEHVDDHQVHLAQRLASRAIVVIPGPAGVGAAVDEAQRLRIRSRQAAPQLREAVRRATTCP